MNAELRAASGVWAQRRGARTTGDLLYAGYLALLTVLVLLVPAVRAGGAVLARPDVLPLLQHPRAPVGLAMALGIAASVLVLLGGTRGPALLSPFLTETLASSAIPRRRVLRRPYLRAIVLPALCCVLAAALAGATLLQVGSLGMTLALLAGLAALGIGLLLGVCWLAGQLLTGPARVLLALVLVALGAGVALGIRAVPSLPLLPASVVALGLGALSTVASLPLLDRLRGRVLRQQALRWQSATMSAETGDLAGAAVAYRPPPAVGRQLPAVGRGGLLLAYARRDAVAWLRSPARSLGGLGLAVIGTALLVAAILLELGLPSWLLAGMGCLLLWWGSGTVVDGLRHAIHTLGSPPLFGQGLGAQLLLHLPAPALLILTVTGGSALAVSLLLGAGAFSAAVLVPMLLAPLLLLGRVWDAAKPPMPLSLTMPMPTPQGDASVLAMLIWQADAPLLHLGIGLVLVLLATAVAPVVAIVGALLALTLLAVLALGRLRALRR